MSKYQELAQQLRTAIVDGEYVPGARLPTIPKLCEHYDVSNTTVKKALDELERQGLVARRRGSGIYVKSLSSLRQGIRGALSTSRQMDGLTNEYAHTNTRISSDVHVFEIVHPTKDIAEALEISTDEFVYHICRTRLTNGSPINVEYTYMPLSIVPGLVEKHVHASIYQYLEKDLGLKIDSAHRVLRAVAPTEDECRWLNITPTMPLLQVHQVAFLVDGTPFEYSTTRHTNDYEFYVVSTH